MNTGSNQIVLYPEAGFSLKPGQQKLICISSWHNCVTWSYTERDYVICLFINKYINHSLIPNLFIRHTDGLELYTGLRCTIHMQAVDTLDRIFQGTYILTSQDYHPIQSSRKSSKYWHYQYLLCAGSPKPYGSPGKVKAFECDASTIWTALEIQCVSGYSVLPPDPILCWNSVGIYFCRVIIATKKALTPLDHSSTDILLPDSNGLYHSSDSSRFWLIWEIEGTSYNRRKYIQSQGGGPALPVSP